MSVITNTTNTSVNSERVVPISKLWRVGLVAIAVSIVGNLIVFGLGRVLGVPFILPLAGPDAPLESLPVMGVIIASTVPLIAATILFAILGKFLSRPIRIFWIIAVIFLLLSLGAPLSLPSEVTISTKVGLSLMHIVSGAAALGVLTTLGREE